LEHLQGLEIQGQLTTSDLAKFQYFHIFRRSWPILAVAIAILILWLAVLIYDMASAPKLYGILANTLPLIVLLFLWTVIIAIRPYIAALRQLKVQSYLGELLRYRFSEENLAVTGPSASWTLAWPGVRSIVETESLFIVYHGPAAATIVPKRFFENSEAADEVRTLLQEHAQDKFSKAGVLGRCC
jgi:hypothetical protein